MKKRKALAVIAIDQQRGWVLPRFGNKPFRYQGLVHFEKDLTWGQKSWTLLVDLAGQPDLCSDSVEATVYFLSDQAPQDVLEEGARFELFMGQVHYTHGRIKRILLDDNAAYPPTLTTGH
jgi:hypothetical protein